MLSFSAPEVVQNQTYTDPSSLPLKAVYRDAVVGIRYRHPHVVPAGASPVSIHICERHSVLVKSDPINSLL